MKAKKVFWETELELHWWKYFTNAAKEEYATLKVSFYQQIGEFVAISAIILLLLVVSVTGCEWLLVVPLAFNNLYKVEIAILASVGQSCAKLDWQCLAQTWTL